MAGVGVIVAMQLWVAGGLLGGTALAVALRRRPSLGRLLSSVVAAAGFTTASARSLPSLLLVLA